MKPRRTLCKIEGENTLHVHLVKIETELIIVLS